MLEFPAAKLSKSQKISSFGLYRRILVAKKVWEILSSGVSRASAPVHRRSDDFYSRLVTSLQLCSILLLGHTNRSHNLRRHRFTSFPLALVNAAALNDRQQHQWVSAAFVRVLNTTERRQAEDRKKACIGSLGTTITFRSRSAQFSKTIVKPLPRPSITPRQSSVFFAHDVLSKLTPLTPLYQRLKCFGVIFLFREIHGDFDFTVRWDYLPGGKCVTFA